MSLPDLKTTKIKRNKTREATAEKDLLNSIIFESSNL